MKTLSRQEKYQLRHIKAGLCRACGKKRVTLTYCNIHRKKDLKRRSVKNKANNKVKTSDLFY